MTSKHTEIAEHVLPGHPDKLCDAAVDAVVDFIRQRDPKGQCGLEAACVFDSLYLTGRIAAEQQVLDELDIDAIICNTYLEAGYGVDGVGWLWGPAPDSLNIQTNLCLGPFVEGERELRHLSDDQAICIGYANTLDETNHLPPAHWLARRIAYQLVQLRASKGAGQIGPDGKVIVSVETHGNHWEPIHVSVSLNHHETSDWLLLREVVDEAVETACAGKATPDIELNGAGMFISGGPNGDNGLSGKKLVVDAYGPTVPIGGGAWSGKDMHKVDRLGGLLARKLALLAVHSGLGNESLITLQYIPGCNRPTRINLECNRKPFDGDVLQVLGNPDVDNLAVWSDYVKTETALQNLARWGHQVPDVPWESLPVLPFV
jgi:S-adenosylmethionine synthetase